jgi:hypothetical protein
MTSLKRWTVWDGILDDSRYLKMPDGFWKLFPALGFKDDDLPILFYLLSRVRETESIVEMDEFIINDFCGVSRYCYFKSLKKIKESLGLLRVKPRFFDMTPVLEKLKIKSTLLLTNGR